MSASPLRTRCADCGSMQELKHRIGEGRRGLDSRWRLSLRRKTVHLEPQRAPRLRSGYECVAWGVPAGTGNSGGSSGMMIQAIGYDKKPITVMNATISHTTRTRVTSISKYSENPRQTPAILRPARGRINLLRARHDPMRTPQ